MSLTKEAIQHLEETKLAETAVKQIANQQLDDRVIALAGGVSLKSLEQFKDFRDSFRFHFTTTSISDFGDYCEEFDQEGAKCFIDPERMAADAIFDIGTNINPLHQLNTAGVSLNKIAAYKTLLKMNGYKLSQKEIAEFIEDWHENMSVFTKEGESMTPMMAVKQLQEITIESARSVESKIDDFSESMSAMEKVEAKNQHLIPSLIKFKCEPYGGLGVREFDLRLSIITTEAKPRISLRIARLEAQQEDMALEFKEILEGIFIDSKLKTFIGHRA